MIKHEVLLFVRRTRRWRSPERSTCGDSEFVCCFGASALPLVSASPCRLLVRDALLYYVPEVCCGIDVRSRTSSVMA